MTTGWFNDAFVEITSGLKEGDLVLLAPIGDEEDESEEMESVETNQPAASTTPPPARQPTEEPSAEGRRFQRPNGEQTGGEIQSDRPRNREGREGREGVRRRPPNSPNAPE